MTSFSRVYFYSGILEKRTTLFRNYILELLNFVVFCFVTRKIFRNNSNLDGHLVHFRMFLKKFVLTKKNLPI